MGQVESTTEVLLAPLCTEHLLLLLLLGKVKLVDATSTVLGGQSGHRVGSCIRIDYSSHMHLKVPDVRGLLVRLNIVARDKVEQLAQGFVILYKVLENLPLLNLFQARAGRSGRWLVRHWFLSHCHVPFSFHKHLVNAIPEACHEILRKLPLLSL